MTIFRTLHLDIRFRFRSPFHRYGTACLLAKAVATYLLGLGLHLFRPTKKDVVVLVTEQLTN